MTKTIVLAYSGGLDTSWCVGHLKDCYRANIVTVFVDVGGTSDKDRDDIERKSLELGAYEHHTIDAREMFFDEVVRHLIFGNVLRGGIYPICVGAERCLQAREVARIAAEIGAEAVAHGCTAAGNDQIRFEVALRTIAPGLTIHAPIRDLEPTRAQEVADLEARDYYVPTKTGHYSVNSGLWGTTIGGRETLGTSEGLPENAWLKTRGAFDAPRESTQHTLRFLRGVPVALDDDELRPVRLIERLDALAGSFGIGRGIHLGDTILGIKGRVAFEAPAATVLISAHRELEKLTMTAEQQRNKDWLARSYGDLVHEGRFLEPACRDIEALFASSQTRVTGVVRLRLRQGSVVVEGVESEYSLHAASRADYGEQAVEWTPADAKGFALLRALPTVLHARAGRTNPADDDGEVASLMDRVQE